MLDAWTLRVASKVARQQKDGSWLYVIDVSMREASVSPDLFRARAPRRPRLQYHKPSPKLVYHNASWRSMARLQKTSPWAKLKGGSARAIFDGDTDTTVAYAVVMAVLHLGVHVGQIQFIAKSLLQDAYAESWTPLTK